MSRREVLNLDRAIERWAKTLGARRLAQKTQGDYVAAMDDFMRILGRDTDPSSLTVEDAEDVLAHERYDALSNTTIGKHISAWRSFSEWGRRRMGWHDWARDLDQPRRERREPRRLTGAEVAAMLMVEPGVEAPERACTTVHLLAYTAARRAGVILVTWGDVDLVEATLILFEKRDKGRTIAIPRPLVEYLARIKETRPPAGVGDRCYVLPSIKEWTPPGSSRTSRVDYTHACSPQAVWRDVKRVAEAAGVRDPAGITPHQFRRFYLEDREAAGVSTITLAELAGHADVRTTALYTGKARLESMRRAVAGIDFVTPHKAGPHRSVPSQDGGGGNRTRAVSLDSILDGGNGTSSAQALPEGESS